MKKTADRLYRIAQILLLALILLSFVFMVLKDSNSLIFHDDQNADTIRSYRLNNSTAVDKNIKISPSSSGDNTVIYADINTANDDGVHIKGNLSFGKDMIGQSVTFELHPYSSDYEARTVTYTLTKGVNNFDIVLKFGKYHPDHYDLRITFGPACSVKISDFSTSYMRKSLPLYFYEYIIIPLTLLTGLLLIGLQIWMHIKKEKVSSLNTVKNPTIRMGFENLLDNSALILGVIYYYAAYLNRDSFVSMWSARYAFIPLLILCMFVNIRKTFAEAGRKTILLSVMASFAMTAYLEDACGESILSGLRTAIPEGPVIIRGIFLWLIAVCLFYTAFSLSVLIYRSVIKFYKQVYRDITKPEIILSLIIIAGAILYVFVYFNRTGAFYYGNYDVIYSADTGSFFSGNVWLNIFHGENDYRQPLFAIFSYPFIGPLYCLIRGMPWLNGAFPFLVNVIYIVMIYISFYGMMRSVFSNKAEQLVFTAAFYALYSSQIYLLIVEQYQIGVFWLFTVLAMSFRGYKERYLPVAAATGTLTTSAVLVLATPERKIRKNIKNIVTDIIKAVSCTVLWVLASGRYDSIYNYFNSTSKWGRENPALTMIDFNHFTQFVRSCIIQPPSQFFFSNSFAPYWRWGEVTVDVISKVGLAVMILCIVGLFLNLKKKPAWTAFLWCVFGFLILAVYAYGGSENTILYGLYFGWSFYLLLAMLADRFITVLRMKPQIGLGLVGTAAVCLFAINARSTWRMTTQFVPYFSNRNYISVENNYGNATAQADCIDNSDRLKEAKLHDSSSEVQPWHLGKTDLEKGQLNSAEIVKSNDGSYGIKSNGALQRESGGNPLLGTYLRDSEFHGIRLSIEDISKYHYLYFEGQKEKDNGQPSVFVYDQSGYILTYFTADYGDLDDKWHTYMLDLSDFSGPVTIILNGAYEDNTGAADSEFTFRDITLY